MREFNQFISDKNSQLWLIYGISGIGKSHFLNELSKESAGNSQPSLLFKVPNLKSSGLLAESLLRQTSIASESVIDCGAQQPANFIKLCRKLQSISPLELLEKETSTNDPVTGLAKFSFMIPRLFGHYKYREHPEKSLLESLAKDLGHGSLVLLFDDHDILAKTSIKTKLKNVSKEGVAEWSYEAEYLSEPFYTWLERVIRYLSCRRHHVYLVITGQKPMLAARTMDLGENAKVYQERWLAPFSQGDIANRMAACSRFSELTEQQLARWSKRILKVTNGLPKWVIELLRVMQNTPTHSVEEIWGNVEKRFHSDSGTGIQRYLVETLTGNEYLKEHVWRLALPYRFDNSIEFQKLLFPRWVPIDGRNAFTVLLETGILQKNPFTSNYILHQTTREALLRTAENHPDTPQLHKELSDYFRSQNTGVNSIEAVQYHEFCSVNTTRLSKLYMSADDYWYQTKSSIQLSPRQKSNWLKKQLPSRDSSVQKRIFSLKEEHQQLALDMAGDGYDFLKNYNLGNSNYLNVLNNKERLDELIQQAPHISDLWFLHSQFELNDGKRLQELQKLVEDVNPYHSLAWFELGMLGWRIGNHEQAKIAFKKAISFGLSEKRKLLVGAYLAWLLGDLQTAKLGMSRTIELESYRFHKNLKQDFELLNRIQNLNESVAVRVGNKSKPPTKKVWPKHLWTYREMNVVILNINEENVTVGPGTQEDIQANQLYHKAKTFIENGLNLEAKNTLYEALAFKKDCRYLLCLSLLLMEHFTNIEEAELLCREAVALEPSDSSNHHALGNLLMMHPEVRLDEAEDSFRTAINLSSNNTMATHWASLGSLLSVQEDRYQDAIAALRKSSLVDPNLFPAWLILGNLLRQKDSKTAAEEAYREAIRIYPSFRENNQIDTPNDSSPLKLERGAFPEDDSSAWNGLAIILAQDKLKYTEAEAAFREAIRIAPKNSNYHSDLGSFLATKPTRHHESEAEYLRAINLNSENASYWNNLGALYLKSSKPLRAKQSLLKAISLEPDAWDSWHNLGGCHPRLTQLDGSMQFMSKLAVSGERVQRGQATIEEYFLIANKVFLPYLCWEEVLFCTEKILDERPSDAKALGLSALAHSYNNEIEPAKIDAELALKEEKFQLYATFAKIKLLTEENDRSGALSLLHDLYNIGHHGADYFTEMQFMERFIGLKDSEYVWRCAQNARAKSEPYYLWVPEYQLALYYWQVEKDVPEVQAIIKIFREQSNQYGKHSVIDLLEAEICFTTGNIKRCQLLLDKISQNKTVSKGIDELVHDVTFTEEEELRFNQLFYNLEQLKVQLSQPSPTSC